MSIDLQQVLAFAPALVLHFVRTGSFFVAMPLFGTQVDSRIYRLILAISLGTIFWWVGDKAVPVPTGVLDFGVATLREAIIGLAAGYAVRATLTVVAVAGEILSHEMGFTMARVMNPVTGTSNTAMAQMFEVFAYLLIFQLDLHHEIIRVLHETYNFVPVGGEFDFRPVFENIGEILAGAIEFGMHYVLPMFAVLLLLTVTLMMLARAVQNINLMEFSFGLRILLALLSSMYFLSEGTPFLASVFRTILGQARGLFAGA